MGAPVEGRQKAVVCGIVMPSLNGGGSLLPLLNAPRELRLKNLPTADGEEQLRCSEECAVRMVKNGRRRSEEELELSYHAPAVRGAEGWQKRPTPKGRPLNKITNEINLPIANTGVARATQVLT